MYAIQKVSRGPGALRLNNVPPPECGDSDVLVKMTKTAVCGTDVHIMQWNEWAAATIPTPMTIGHEFVGTVARAGSNAQGFTPGMRVSGEGHIVCGKCRNCLAGRRHLCKDTSGIGVNRPGIFAEYAAIPASNIWICDDSIPDELFACFDPLGNAVHSCLKFDAAGEDVLITGAGPIGLMSVAIMKHIGARNIVVTDLNPYRLDLAMKMGATRAVDIKIEKLPEVMRELKMKEGFDIGLEMSGNEDAFREMVSLMFHGGKIALLGLQDGESSRDFNTVIFSGLTITGIYGRQMYETWYKMSSMLQSGLNIGGVITHRLNYTDFQEAFDTAASGQSGKVILNWDEG
jgi:threonine 3-dehydrogenase